MPQAPDFSYDVFLSHNAKDKPRCKDVDFRQKARTAFGEGATTCQVETGAMKRRFGLPHGAEARDMICTMSPLIDQFIANRIQSRPLATLRNTLLPKPLSGALRIDELAGSVVTAR